MKMRSISLLFLLLFTIALCAQDNLSALIPYPNEIKQRNGFFNIDKNIAVAFDNNDLQFAASQLEGIINKHFDRKLSIASNENNRLQINSNLSGEEAYKLDVGKKSIVIEGKTASGVLYAIMTLDQILTGDIVN